MTGKLSFRKKALYASLVTTAFFAAIECLLAIANVHPTLTIRDPYVGFEGSIPLFVEHRSPEPSPVVVQTAANKLAYFNHQAFPKTKSNQTFRIFCLGGSTTYGQPYNDSTSFCGWLRELLPNVDSSRRWEVVNAGGISYASYRVAAVLEEVLRYSPDLVIVYTGHNEFLEERSYREQRTESPGVRRLTSWLHRTRTFSLLDELLGQQPAPNGRWLLPAEVDAILDHESGPHSYHRDEMLRAQVLQHFQFNLDKIVQLSRSAGAEVLLVSPAANLKDFSPFKSEFSQALTAASEERWFQLFADAEELKSKRRPEKALAALSLAADIDDGRADLHFLRGTLLQEMGRYTEAKTAFLQAIDEDICALRALPKIHSAIEHTALSQRVPLIDFAAILDHDCLRSYGHPCPGREYFVDHVHPNVATHRLLAMAIIEALDQRGIVHPIEDWRSEPLAAVSRKIESRISPDFQSRALTNLAQVLSWAGKQQEAGPIALQAVALRAEHKLSEDFECQFYAGVYLAMQGATEHAIGLLANVAKNVPENSQAHWRLATLYYEQDLFDAARSHLERAIEIEPGNADLHQMLGVIHADMGEKAASLRCFQQAYKLAPDNPRHLESVRSPGDSSQSLDATVNHSHAGG